MVLYIRGWQIIYLEEYENTKIELMNDLQKDIESKS